MVKYFFQFLLVGTITLCSCESEKVDYFTNDEKWVPILADMYALQVVVETFDQTKRDSVEQHLKETIYKIHQVDSIEIADFLDHLMIHPDKSAEMYDRVVKYLDEKENLPEQ